METGRAVYEAGFEKMKPITTYFAVAQNIEYTVVVQLGPSSRFELILVASVWRE